MESGIQALGARFWGTLVTNNTCMFKFGVKPSANTSAQDCDFKVFAFVASSWSGLY